MQARRASSRTYLPGHSSPQRCLQVRWQAPWNATVALGPNNVLDRTDPVLYGAPSANVFYNGKFDIGCSLYMTYSRRF